MLRALQMPLKEMLSEDFGNHLNLSLYKGEQHDEPLYKFQRR